MSIVFVKHMCAVLSIRVAKQKKPNMKSVKWKSLQKLTHLTLVVAQTASAREHPCVWVHLTTEQIEKENLFLLYFLFSNWLFVRLLLGITIGMMMPLRNIPGWVDYFVSIP